MKLIVKKFCPYCKRVELGLKIRKISSENVHIETPKDGLFPQSFIHINPRKTFPTLVITNNFGFAESMIVLEYIDSIQSSGPKLFGESSENIAKTKFNIDILNTEILSFLKKSIYNFESSQDEIYHFSQMNSIFQKLDQLLEKEEKRYFGGEELNAEDILMVPFIMAYIATKSIKKSLPMPKSNSRSETYFNDLAHHSMVRKCYPSIEDLANHLLEYNEKKKQKIKEIKEADRSIVANPKEKISLLNSLTSSVKWTLEKDIKGNSILGHVTFRGTTQSLEALKILNNLQEAANHHSTFHFENFHSLKVKLCTHEPHYGITNVDFAFADAFSLKMKELLSS